MAAGDIAVRMCKGISVAFENGLGLKIKTANNTKINSLKQLKTANLKSPWPYFREGSGLIYTDAVSFVNASLSMRLRLPFTRRRSRPLLKPSPFKNAVKVERFENNTVSSIV